MMSIAVTHQVLPNLPHMRACVYYASHGLHLLRRFFVTIACLPGLKAVLQNSLFLS